MTDWQPQEYLRFCDERTRAARDLLSQVPLASADVIYDLGCGPGNSTSLLVERFPGARITGVDNSPAMLAQARRDCPQADYQDADLSQWSPDEQPSLLFSNATFQWVPDHVQVLARLARSLKPGGVMAVQMPDNLREPSHRLIQAVAEEGAWAGKLAKASSARDPLPEPREYYRRLKQLFSRLDIWHTVYNHVLQGPAGIVQWISSTGLRPYLNSLAEDERQHFISAYQARLADAYPAMDDGMVLLRFPRLFIVGVR